jgi:hypothetical protein
MPHRALPRTLLVRRLAVLLAVAVTSIGVVVPGASAAPAAAVVPTLTMHPTDAAADPAAPVPYVRRCGTRLCLANKTFPLHGASALFSRDDPTGTAASARAAGLNTLRITNWLQEDGDLRTGPYDAKRWAGVDRVIAAARAQGLKVELDLTTYRNFLQRHRINPYGADWGPFVRWVAARRNTVTGARYATDPTIALVAFAAEVEPPGSPASPVRYTTQQITSFFARTLGQWRAVDAVHLLTPGGLLHLDYDTGIDWRSIMRLPVVDVCGLHVYSPGDENVTVPAVSAFCTALDKPWFTEEFGAERGMGDPQRAAYFTRMYQLQTRYGSAGAQIWNLGPQVKSPTYDVNPNTPLTWHVVQVSRQAALPATSWTTLQHLERLDAAERS